MTRETARKRPGPPKAFDIDAALRAAIIVFWQKGFDGASLTELTKAMGINRPSLYGTFGDKQALYLRALDWYDQQGELTRKMSSSFQIVMRPRKTAISPVCVVFRNGLL